MCPQVIKVEVVEAFTDTWSLGLSWDIIISTRASLGVRTLCLNPVGQQWKLTRALLSKGTA